jgi:hypothetical protein
MLLTLKRGRAAAGDAAAVVGAAAAARARAPLAPPCRSLSVSVPSRMGMEEFYSPALPPGEVQKSAGESRREGARREGTLLVA